MRTAQRHLFAAATVVLAGAAVAGITNATGARLEALSLDVPSGDRESSNALGAVVIVASDPMSPMPQTGPAGAVLLPEFPPGGGVPLRAAGIDVWVID